MEDARPTERQVDTADGVGKRGRATIAHVRVVHGECAKPVHEISSIDAVIGREGDLCVVDNAMSRRHVAIERTPAGWRLVDLGSKNGGYVDGRAFRPDAQVALGDGMVIRLGGTLLVFRTSPAPDETAAGTPAFPGVSPAAVRVRRQIDSLRAASGHALVLGETGTGKERVALAIADSRTGLPLVTLNCGELSRELARSELFGHVQGAFSGATHAKPGLVEVAGDGALFLDEIGELPLDVQVELLRFLEDGTYRPIGMTRQTLRSTARVVAATNVDLDQAVASGKFRRDLLGRLRARNMPLELPPLRDRREDIPHWIRLFARDEGYTGADPWSAGALECMVLYPWPDNLRGLLGQVRELLESGARMPWDSDDLFEKLRNHRSALRGDDPAPPAPAKPPRPSGPASPSVAPTRSAIEDALRQTQGNVAAAVRRLGVERTKLYRMFDELDIDPDDYRDGGPKGADRNRAANGAAGGDDGDAE